MKHARMVVHGALAGLLLAGAIAGALASRPYTSTSVIRIVPGQIPDNFVPSQRRIDPDTVLQTSIQAVTSRGRLVSLINSYNLYPEQHRSSMEDAVERMRGSITITAIPAASVRISFAHPDRFLSQKVTKELMEAVIVEHSRWRVNQASMTLQFMSETARAAAAMWEHKLSNVRAAQTTGQPLDRVNLEATLARQRYESLSAKAFEAEVLHNLEARQQGTTLEVFDPASLPADTRPSIGSMVIIGLATGALLGWLVPAFSSLGRSRRQPQPA